jgi:hypothetical protein
VEEERKESVFEWRKRGERVCVSGGRKESEYV